MLVTMPQMDRPFASSWPTRWLRLCWAAARGDQVTVAREAEECHWVTARRDAEAAEWAEHEHRDLDMEALVDDHDMHAKVARAVDRVDAEHSHAEGVGGGGC
jgi:hypothetical protein